MRLRAKFADQSSTRSMLECLIPANMERASKVLGKLSLPEGTVTPEAMVCAAWAGAVGKKIAAHARAAQHGARALIVEVEDAVWQRQLFVLRRQIRRKIEKSIWRRDAWRTSNSAWRRGGANRSVRSTRWRSADEARCHRRPGAPQIYKASRKRALA